MPSLFSVRTCRRQNSLHISALFFQQTGNNTGALMNIFIQHFSDSTRPPAYPRWSKRSRTVNFPQKQLASCCWCAGCACEHLHREASWREAYRWLDGQKITQSKCNISQVLKLRQPYNHALSTGSCRIRSRTQGIALSLGDRITIVQRGVQVSREWVLAAEPNLAGLWKAPGERYWGTRVAPPPAMLANAPNLPKHAA